jgi:2-oxo-3-hexenedioate decarboxylase
MGKYYNRPMPAAELSEELVDLHGKPRPVPPFTARHPGLTAAAGYEAAAALHRHRLALGWKPVGRKIGFTNRTIWPRYGVYEPIWGMVYDRTLVPSAGNAATVSLAGLVQPRIEPEICFGLKARPRPEHIVEAIAWVAHSIEIVQCYHPDWKLQLADSTAANGLHGRLVVGEKVPLADLPGLVDALPRVRIALLKGDRTVDRGIGANVLDSPLLALAYLVNVLAAQPRAPALAPGEVISTGTLTDAHPVAPGETWSTALEGLPLPGLTVRFE